MVVVATDAPLLPHQLRASRSAPDWGWPPPARTRRTAAGSRCSRSRRRTGCSSAPRERQVRAIVDGPTGEPWLLSPGVPRDGRGHRGGRRERPGRGRDHDRAATGTPCTRCRWTGWSPMLERAGRLAGLSQNARRDRVAWCGPRRRHHVRPAGASGGSATSPGSAPRSSRAPRTTTRRASARTRRSGRSFGYGLLWTGAVHAAPRGRRAGDGRSAGLTTGHGLATSIGRRFPRPVLWFAVALVCVANVFNIGADLASMAAAIRLLVPLPFAVVIVALALRADRARGRDLVPPVLEGPAVAHALAR